MKDSLLFVVVNRLSSGDILLMTNPVELSSFMKNQVFVAFDTETTGLWAPTHRIVEIGAIKFSFERGVDGKFQTLVNPQRKIPKEVIKIHGITDEMVAGSDPIGPVLQKFIEFCPPDSILIAHNAPFDISFVACEFERTEMPLPKNSILDTIDLYQTFHPGQQSYSLLSLVRSFKLADSQSHRALADAIYVQKLFQHCKQQLSSIQSAQELFDLLPCYHLSDWKAAPARLPARFAALEQSAKDKGRVSIVYQNSGLYTGSRIVRPSRFYSLGERHYMSAYCEFRGEERTFRLDRIESYEILDAPEESQGESR